MGYIINGFHNVEWINRDTLRANKEHLTNGRGGSKLRNAVLGL